MKFNEKLDKQFAGFKVGIPKISKHHHHLYADYVELVALFNKTETTKTDILDRLFDEGITFYEDEDKPEADDKNEIWISEIFDVIQYRKKLFTDDYPFSFEKDVLKLKEKTSEKNQLYLSLLISSSLNYFHELQPELTSEFEVISYNCLKNYMPENAIVKSTGENSDYKGTAIEKIRMLANEINITINESELSNISKKNVKEKGLDLIAWIPFEDKIPNLITVLAQCACGKEWEKKQYETERYENYLRFFHKKPLHSIYIPYSISKEKSFFQSDDITGDRIIFDRKRILEFIPDTSFFNILYSKKIIEKSLEYEEDIV